MEFGPDEIRIDQYRTASGVHAVRVTHLPTGASVDVEDQPTTEGNREKALALLRDVLHDRNA